MKRYFQKLFRKLFHQCDHQYVIQFERVSPRVFMRYHRCIYCGKIKSMGAVAYGTCGDAEPYI